MLAGYSHLLAESFEGGGPARISGGAPHHATYRISSGRDSDELNVGSLGKSVAWSRKISQLIEI